MKTRSQVNKASEDVKASAAGALPQNLPVKKRHVDVRQCESVQPDLIQKPNLSDTNASSIETHTGASKKAEGVGTQEERQQPAERQNNVNFIREENIGHYLSPFDRNSLGQVPGISSFVDAGAFPGIVVAPGAFTSLYASPDSTHQIQSLQGVYVSPLVGTSKASGNRTNSGQAGSEQAPRSPFIPTGRMTLLSLNDSSHSGKSTADTANEPTDLEFVPLLSGIDLSGTQLAIQHASPRGLHQVGASIDTPRASFGSQSSGFNFGFENQLASHPSRSESQILVHHIASDAQSAATDQDKKTAKRKKFRRWTKEEDEKLKAAVDRVGGPPIDWVTVVEAFDGERTSRQCKTRWKNALSPHINHEPFTKQEEHIIISCRKSGMGWPAIAKLMQRRTSEQIRDRFINHINPELKTTPWTKEEDDELIEAQKRLGNKWTEISKILVGRSEKAIKNRWYNRKTMQSRKVRREEIEKARNAKYASISSSSCVSSVSCSDKKSPSLSAKEDGKCATVGLNEKSSARASDIVCDDKHPPV